MTERRTLLEEIAREIGQANVDKLIHHLGGTRTYIPARMPVNHELAVILGVRTATRLAEKFHTHYLDLPKAHARRQRALETALDPPPGMTIKEIALAFDYSERGLYALLEAHRKREAESRRQLNMFDTLGT